MLWRIWTLAAGGPLGLAFAMASNAALSPQQLVACAVAGGAVMLAFASTLARVRTHEPERARHVAGAASWGWLGLPAIAAAWLGWAPGPWPYPVAAAAVTALSMLRAAQVMGPGPGPLRWAANAVAAVGAGLVAALAAAAGMARLMGGVPDPPESWIEAVYDLDAQVATRPLPRCEPAITRAEVVLERGAHPALSGGGRVLWFDARAEGGRRQIHRMDRDSGEVSCWTCPEPGHNRRPSLDPAGTSLVFESDRAATWRRPHNSELHLIGARPRRGQNFSRRITFNDGPDTRAVLGPAGVLVWSQRESGRFRVVAAALRSGHGGLMLGRVQPLADGEGAWIAPLAWSPDARQLVIARGNPFAPLEAHALDPATGARVSLGSDVAPAVSFSADGGWLVYAVTRPARIVANLPAAFGGLLAPRARATSLRGMVRRSTGLRSAASPGPGAEVALADAVAGWGEPTGVALEPDGTGLVLGQRRAGETGIEERLLALSFDCAQDPAASTPGGER